MWGVLKYSGLVDLEKSANDLSDARDKGEADFWDYGKVGVNGLLAALTFFPGVAALKTFFTTTKAVAVGQVGRYALRRLIPFASWGGKAITGMRAPSTSAGNTVIETVGSELTTLVNNMKNLDDAGVLLDGVKAYARRYGVMIDNNVSLGMAIPNSAKSISVNLSTGAQHEIVHVVQMVQTHVSALRSYAADVGKSVAQLTATEVDDVWKLAIQPFQELPYTTFERYALASSPAFKKTVEVYKEALVSNIGSFITGIKNAVVPATDLSALTYQGAYGYLMGIMPNLFLGTSNLQGAINLLGGIIPFVKYQNEPKKRTRKSGSQNKMTITDTVR